jgi:hypothetical protein
MVKVPSTCTPPSNSTVKVWFPAVSVLRESALSSIVVLPEVATYQVVGTATPSTFTTFVNSPKYLSTRKVRLQLVPFVYVFPLRK